MAYDVIIMNAIYDDSINEIIDPDDEGEVQFQMMYKRSGVDLLIQKIIKLFLTSPGSDMYDKEAFGVGFEQMSRTTDPDELITVITASISNIRSIILNDYKNNPGSDRTDAETLRDMEVLNVVKDDSGRVSVDVRVFNENDDTIDFNVAVRKE